MSMNDRNEDFFDKNDAAADASEGELSQDELDNVSGGLRAAKNPEGFAKNPEGFFDDDKSDARSIA